MLPNCWVVVQSLLICNYISHATAQHSQCGWNGGPKILDCQSRGDYDNYVIKIPENFDVFKVNVYVEVLWLSSTRHNDITHGIVRGDYQPFPSMPRLRELFIRGFNQASTAMKFPLKELFQNANSMVKSLHLVQTRLEHLAAEDFCGFNSLQTLTIENCGVLAIDASAFRSVVPLSSGLMTIFIQNNTIGQLDFSTFAPLAESLRTLDLQGNKFTADGLTVSDPETKLRKLEVLRLFNNKLNHIPLHVLETLNATVVRTLELDYNPICELHPDCGCCGMKPAAEWINTTSITLAGQIFCGNRGRIAVRQMPKIVPYPEDCSSVEPDQLRVCDQVKSAFASRTDGMEDKFVSVVPSLRTECLVGNLTFSDNNLSLVKSTGLHLTIDGTFKCKKLLHDVHVWMLTNIQHEAREKISSEEGQLVVLCDGGRFGVSEMNPDGLQTSKFIFDSDVTRKCRNAFFELLDYLTTFNHAPRVTEL